MIRNYKAFLEAANNTCATQQFMDALVNGTLVAAGDYEQMQLEKLLAELEDAADAGQLHAATWAIWQLWRGRVGGAWQERCVAHV